MQLSPSTAWLVLTVAGLFETAWAIGLKYSAGFTRPLPTVLTVVAIVISMSLLGWAARSLPIGTAYAVWTGIGAIGAVLLGILLFGESAQPLRLACIGLIVIGILGLKFIGPE
ncbi:MAG TPA: quaternary ammonium compound efflux SMR transporter SugE [Gammaproteobacteria bacterium]|nr:quaternary ammonium compound efflux SMR transporter SugE [Gammaproteobacteria bacterium]